MRIIHVTSYSYVTFLSYSYSTQHWVVFEKVSELIILVPALLGLKGNLEMTLASRLSTQANLGHMDTPKQQWYMIVGNLVLIQVSRIQILFLLFPFIFKFVYKYVNIVFFPPPPAPPPLFPPIYFYRYSPNRMLSTDKTRFTDVLSLASRFYLIVHTHTH